MTDSSWLLRLCGIYILRGWPLGQGKTNTDGTFSDEHQGALELRRFPFTVFLQFCYLPLDACECPSGLQSFGWWIYSWQSVDRYKLHVEFSRDVEQVSDALPHVSQNLKLIIWEKEIFVLCWDAGGSQCVFPGAWEEPGVGHWGKKDPFIHEERKPIHEGLSRWKPLILLLWFQSRSQHPPKHSFCLLPLNFNVISKVFSWQLKGGFHRQFYWILDAVSRWYWNP